VTRDDEYLEGRVLTARPEQLHLLVVEGAIRHARRAKQMFENGDEEGGLHELISSREFVGEMIGGLDRERGPEIVEQVAPLFIFVYRRLAEAEVLSEPGRIDDALRILEMHHETWLSLLDAAVPKAPAGPPAPHATPAPPAYSAESGSRSWSG
jgi:flagellar protein FliS